jgi:hypothetical protein
VKHLAHLRHLHREDEDERDPAKRGKRPRSRLRPAVTAGIAVAAAIVIGVVAAFAVSGHNTPPPPGAPSPNGSTAGAPAGGGGATQNGAAAAAGGSAGATQAAAPVPSVYAVDVSGAPLTAPVLAIERQVISAASAHDSAALDQLLDPTGPETAAALNKVLAEPGVYGQIVSLLSKTHGVPQDGFTGWPGFLLAGGNLPLAAADLKALGAASPQEYKGIGINIGASYQYGQPLPPPKLYSIVLNG